MNTNVDTYFTDGCGRCSLYGTPDCKVLRWTKELRLLRRIAQDCGLDEESKWGIPCYTYKGANVAMIAAFKDHVALSFFKGVLLEDVKRILDKPGENSQSVRLFRFSNVDEIIPLEASIKAYLFEAVEIEKSGLKVEFKQKDQLVFPEELLRRFETNPVFKEAFFNLTPGRQRGYNLYFTAAKQSKTRESRIDKYIPKIMDGKGWNER